MDPNKCVKFRVNRIRSVFLSKMAAKPCDFWGKKIFTMYADLMEDGICKFSLRWLKEFQRKHYLIFFLNPTWRPNHVTYQFEINKLISPSCPEYSCEISPSSDQRFWRRRCLKVLGFFQDGRQTMWPINKKLTNLKEDLMGNICVKFRLNLSGRSGEEDF